MKKYKILYDSELIIHKHVFIADSAEICGERK